MDHIHSLPLMELASLILTRVYYNSNQLSFELKLLNRLKLCDYLVVCDRAVRQYNKNSKTVTKFQLNQEIPFKQPYTYTVR